MKKRSLLSLLLSLVLCITGCAGVLNVAASDTATEYLITQLDGKYKTQGRTSVVDGVLMLDWSATGIEFIADCEGEVKLTVNSNISHAFFTVIIDDVVQYEDLRIPDATNWTADNMEYPFYIRQKGESTFVIAENLSSGEHKIEIYAQNESANGIWGIKSITLNGTIKDAPAQKEKYIEVVGDSIVAGYGNIVNNSITFEHHNFHTDATRGWPYRVAQALDADWSIMGYSGVCTDTWNGKIWPTMVNCYPLQRHITVDSSTKYQFEREPDVILISLGTNDMAQYAKYNSTLDEVEAGYCNFLTLLRLKNPNARIIWLYGMMTSNNSRILSAVESMGGEENGYYTLNLPQDQTGGGYHPSASAQITYSEMIVDYVNEISDDSYVPVKNIIPTYDFAEHTDLTKASGLSTADYVGVENQGSNVGLKMWTDIASGGHRSVKVIDESLIDGATEIYGSGTIKFTSSGYEPNAAYHYVYMPIISATMGENTGYLSLVFRGNGANATLSFVTGSGESTAATNLTTFYQTFTEIGGSHEVKYLLDTENGTLSVQIDGTDVLSKATLPENITLNGVTAGAGMYYAGLLLTDYRVYAKSSSNVPTYDESKHSVVSTFATYELSDLELSNTVYGTIELSAKKSGTNIYDGFMLYLGDATVQWTNSSGLQTRTGKWYIDFTRGDSIDLQLYDSTNGYFYWGANSKKYVYPDSGNANFTGPYKVTYALTADNLKLWVNGVKVMDYDYTSWSTASGTAMTATLNSFATGYADVATGTAVTAGSGYKVWVEGEYNRLGIPGFDADSQLVLGEKTHFYSDYYQPPSTVIDISDKVNGTSAVYTTYTISGKTYLNGYHGSMVYLAAAGDDIWALRLIDDYGWCLGKAIEEGYTADGTYLIVNANYPDGTQTMSALTITVKAESNKVTVWMSDGENEIIALDNYELSGMTGAAVGMDSFGSGASITAKTWVDNENYAYLGDLNGDMSINVLDFIVANKLAANTEGVTAFNDNVKAFNDAGTVGTAELIKMKKYLLGVIGSFK